MPVDVSERSLLISWSTSCLVTQRNIKEEEREINGFSEKECTSSIRPDISSGLLPSVLSLVLIKNSFSLSVSAWRGLGLGWKIRWIILQTFLGRLDESALVMNDRLDLLIVDLILLRTSLNASQESSVFFSWASRPNLSRSACNLRIWSEFINGAGGRVTFILLRGACLSMHSPQNIDYKIL